MRSLLLLAWLACAPWAAGADPVAPRWIKGEGDVQHLGQPAVDGILELTATNGFFDSGFSAVESGPMVPGDNGLIAVGFGALAPTKAGKGEARWHLFVGQPGELKLELHMSVPASEAGRPWVVRVGSEQRAFKATASDGKQPQLGIAPFQLTKPGKVEVVLSYGDPAPPVSTQLRRIRLEGSAVPNAHLLRARWRPAAVHARFFAPAACKDPSIWVFETRAVSKISSYSPMTTPFGYFGTVFDEQGRVPKNGSFNFSMWVGSDKATAAPPLPEMSRLLATSLPDAEYSTFGHEGTGVKFRKATAYPEGAARTIQALRAERKGSLWTFHGYFYDESRGRWRLFASAQDFDPRRVSKDAGTLRSTGSFCEVPGPPAVERTGDLPRVIARRGWFQGSDGTWHAAILEPTRESRGTAGTSPTNQRVTQDKEGWFVMATGGVDFLPSAKSSASASASSPTLPDYLSPAKVAQLREGSVDFKGSVTKVLPGGAAEVTYRLGSLGPAAQAVLHYGTVDCLTFVAGKPVNNSSVERDIYSPARVWQKSTPSQTASSGNNVFRLAGLTPGSTYHYRLFVSHGEGKAWDEVSGSFVAR